MILNTVTTSNFIITLLMACSMQQLWGMIRAMQTIILAVLVQIPMPGHTLIFMQGCMNFAQMDLLDGAEYYEKMFEFKPTNPLDYNFEWFGIADKNMMMNSGSYFVFVLGFFLINFGLFIINKIATRFARHRQSRRIGMKIYSKSYLGDLWF